MNLWNLIIEQNSDAVYNLFVIKKNSLRKIIHVDMDCFYAAIEVRDNPLLSDKPVAVGGSHTQRGVLCTCNYLARKFGVRSAMPTATALRLCKDLVVLPVNMEKYRAASRKIQAIFYEFTELVEPLSLDEAYLDVTDSLHHHGSATLIAQAIRQRIWEEEKLAASAGVAPNKFLAKIASGWRKPNALFVIRPPDVAEFVENLPIEKLFGVGKVTAEKLHLLGLKTCADIQKLTLLKLTTQFGKMGERLYEQCRGLDSRVVEPNRIRKSLSVERTFHSDINDLDKCLIEIDKLYQQLLQRLQLYASNQAIKSHYIKIKFNDFKLSTAETAHSETTLQNYLNLFRASHSQQTRPIRLLGLGVHFDLKNNEKSSCQQSML